MGDLGHPDIAADIWTAVLVPAGTSAEIIEKLYSGVVVTLARPEVIERMDALGYAAVGTSPKESDAELRRDREVG